MIDIHTCTHWGRDGYPNTTLPSDERQALAKYLKAASAKATTSAKAQGSAGVTVFRKPLTVVGLVRGLDKEGRATMWLITEGEGARMNPATQQVCRASARLVADTT